jgi:hypothetical protein
MHFETALQKRLNQSRRFLCSYHPLPFPQILYKLNVYILTGASTKKIATLNMFYHKANWRCYERHSLTHFKTVLQTSHEKHCAHCSDFSQLKQCLTITFVLCLHILEGHTSC